MGFKRSGKKTKAGVLVLSVFFFFSLWGTVMAEERSASLLGYIVIPDISGTAERLHGYAEAVEPGKYSKDYFSSKLGSQVGDPSLENIKRNMPVVLMLFQNTGMDDSEGSSLNRMEYAVIIPVKDKTRYIESMQKMNMLYDTNDDRLIISNKKSSLFFAQREMKFYRKLSREKYSSDIRAAVNIDNLMAANRSSIETGLKMLQAINTLNQYSGGSSVDEAQLAIGKLFIYSLLELALQSKDYQLDVLFEKEYIDFSGEFSALPGSALSRYFDGETQAGNKCLALLPGRGQLTYAGYLDMARLRELVEDLLSLSLKREPSLENYLNRDLVNAYLDYTRLYTGEFAVTYGFNSSGRLEINAAAATGKSSKEHVEANEKFMALYEEVLKKYSGISAFSGYTMEKNYRKSGGADVYRYIMNMDLAKMPDSEKEMMLKMFGEKFIIEFAVSNGYLAASSIPENLDRIIASTVSTPAGTELISMKAFGAGMDSYIDMDIIGFIERIIELSSGDKTVNDPSIENFKKLLKNLNEGERNILLSAKYSKGVSYSRCRVSARMITEFINAVKEADKDDSAQVNSEDDESVEEIEE